MLANHYKNQSHIKISIAMATYNGSLYIRDQLDSFCNQILVPEELVICDDGSTDETVSIIRYFAQNATFPVRFYQNSHNLGFADNFLNAASLCQSDWIAFSDQDDVWLPDKLSSIAQVIQNHEKDNLLIVTHSAELTDANLNSIGRYQPKYFREFVVPRNHHYGFWELPGFTCVFKKALIHDFDWRSRPPSYDRNFNFLPHDKWICMLANALGSVYYISKPLALYRRHESALTGSYIKPSLQQLISLSHQVTADHYKLLSEIALQSSEFFKSLSESSSNPQQKIFLMENGLNFITLSEVYLIRYKIYQEKNYLYRFVHLLKLITKKGYFGNKFYSFGILSLMKDIYTCFLK